jgi:hypothetical protein
VELESELDSLYAAQLEDFVRLRNERAAALRKEGERAMSAALKEQAKPNFAAWVVNQLVRRHPEKIGELIETSDSLRRAQERALRGDTDEFDQSLREQRKLIRELLGDAERIIEETGREPTAATLDRISQSLRAAPTDEEGRELLRKGRVVGDVEAVGFGALTGMKLPARSRDQPKPKPKREPVGDRPRLRLVGGKEDRAEKRARVAEARQALLDARDREREVRRRLKEAERRAEEARRVATRALEEVEALKAEADEANAGVASAEEAVRAARR